LRVASVTLKSHKPNRVLEWLNYHEWWISHPSSKHMGWLTTNFFYFFFNDSLVFSVCFTYFLTFFLDFILFYFIFLLSFCLFHFFSELFYLYRFFFFSGGRGSMKPIKEGTLINTKIESVGEEDIANFSNLGGKV